MEQEELDQLWKIVLSEIETEVSRANFLTLFKHTLLLTIDETTATVAAPSSMIIDLLQRRFYQIIKKSLDKQTEKNMEILFVPKTIVK